MLQASSIEMAIFWPVCIPLDPQRESFALTASPTPPVWLGPFDLAKLPSVRDLTRRMEWAASNDLNSISATNRQWAEATFNPEVLLAAWERVLLPLVRQTR